VLSIALLPSLIVVATAPTRQDGDDEVTLAGLLGEMVDLDALARWPEPAYVTRQESSRDRRSRTPDVATEEGWFANVDNMEGMGGDVRWVKHGGRDECRLVDVQGPGALVRFWTGGKKPEGTLRFYVDERSEPVLAGPALELLSGAGPIPPPLAIQTAGEALNLHLPIPFAKRLEITYDEGAPPAPPPQRWFNAEYRIYAPDVGVRSLVAGDLERARRALEATARALGGSAAPEDDELELRRSAASAGAVVPRGEKLDVKLERGPAAIRSLTLSFPRPTGDAELAEPDLRGSLRTLVVEAEFDGEATVWCPASEFFGCGPALAPLETRTRSVREDGREARLSARFTMPFQKRASVAILNLGRSAAPLRLRAETGPWRWDERSLRFHATWRSESRVPTRPFRDWNLVTIEGRGVYAGDTLTVMNPTESWWGEGDEKVWRDGEPFPSHFGTGTEDCYGYAWGSTALFRAPFMAQPRCDGPGNLGFTTVTRTRALDGIPFARSLQYDLEVWHWAECEMSYAAACYWYARPGAKSNRAPDFEGAAAPLRAPGLPGAVECESAEVVASSPDLVLSRQSNLAFPSGRWSCDAQLLVQAKAIGDFVELRLARGLDERRRLLLHPTTSYDYGVLRFYVNGRRAGRDFDAWSERSALGPVLDLGDHAPRRGEFVLRVEVAGRNPSSRGAGCFFGLDAVELLAE
jgi:hypothetical protein